MLMALIVVLVTLEYTLKYQVYIKYVQIFVKKKIEVNKGKKLPFSKMRILLFGNQLEGYHMQRH